ncbi:uncharacterized protein [Littorina saxatilis]|uniref:uncharacterized protein n=1 Tax=Littorina saxatilis TaxID=31220 RepID=UPI0038B4A8EC
MSPPTLQCGFCGHGKEAELVCGKLFSAIVNKEKLIAHHKCMKYSAGLTQYKFDHFGGFDVEEVCVEMSRGKQLSCNECKQEKKKSHKGTKRGATAGCGWKKCGKTFHFYCAKQAGKTSRRKHKTKKGKLTDLYWVFCSDEHKEKYLESEEGKGTFSCSDTDEEQEGNTQTISNNLQENRNNDNESGSEESEDIVIDANVGEGEENEGQEEEEDDDDGDIDNSDNNSGALEEEENMSVKPDDRSFRSDSESSGLESVDEMWNRSSKTSTNEKAKAKSRKGKTTPTSKKKTPKSKTKSSPTKTTGKVGMPKKSPEQEKKKISKNAKKQSKNAKFPEKEDVSVDTDSDSSSLSDIRIEPKRKFRSTPPAQKPFARARTSSNNDEHFVTPAFIPENKSKGTSRSSPLMEESKQKTPPTGSPSSKQSPQKQTVLHEYYGRKNGTKIVDSLEEDHFWNDDDDIDENEEEGEDMPGPSRRQKKSTKSFKKATSTEKLSIAEILNSPSKTDKGKKRKLSPDKKTSDEKSKADTAKKMRSAGAWTVVNASEMGRKTACKGLGMEQTRTGDQGEGSPKRKKQTEHKQSPTEDMSDDDSELNGEEEEQNDSSPDPPAASLSGDSDSGSDAGSQDQNGPGQNANLYPVVNVRKPEDARKKKNKKENSKGGEYSGAFQRKESWPKNVEPPDDASECVLAILADPLKYDTVKAQVQRKIAQHFTVEENHVHFWNAVAPVMLPSSCMLHFFVDIANALKKKDWNQLRQLLLDTTTILGKLDGEYKAFISLQKKLTDLEADDMAKKYKEDTTGVLQQLVCLLLKEARKKNRYQLGVFTTISQVDCLLLLVGDIADEKQSLRHSLHQQPVLYRWPDCDVSCAASPVMSPEQQESYQLQESMILQAWFTTKFLQLHKVILLPKEEILQCERDSDGSGDAFTALCDAVENLVVDEAEESDLPVVVLLNKVNAEMITLETYIQWNIKKYSKDFSKQQVVFAFHVESLGTIKHTQISLDEPGRRLEFSSAFNPSEKPVSFVVAVVAQNKSCR